MMASTQLHEKLDHVAETQDDGVELSAVSSNGHISKDVADGTQSTCDDMNNGIYKALSDGIENRNSTLIQNTDVDGDLANNVELSHKENIKSLTEPKKALDGGWGWFIILGGLILRVVIGGIQRSNGLFYIRFLERYHGSATSTALVTSLTAFVRLSSGPFISILSGKFKIRVLTAFGACIMTSGLIMTAYSPSIELLYFSYGIVGGFGRSLALTPFPILLGYYFDKRRSLAFGLASAGFSIGGFAITPLVPILFQEYGFQGTFLLLGALSMHVLIASALFRPIELQRKLTDRERKRRPEKEQESLMHNSERKEPGDDTNFSAQSDMNSLNVDLNLPPKPRTNTDIENKHKRENNSEHVQLEASNIKLNTALGKLKFWNKLKRKNKPKSDVKKTKLISWSILKDFRFLCYVCATFFFSLPASGLFLPALAKTKGLSDIQAATLLSVSAGIDTVSRVFSGIVLDFKVFRSIRPQIYNLLTFLLCVVQLLFPFMNSFTTFMVLCSFEGVISGIKVAQGSVIMMDMLGVDKLASSLAVTMAVHSAAILVGPVVSGQLKDITGNYDGAFYFASGAIFLGGAIMAVGNIQNHCQDTRRKKTSAGMNS